MSAPGPKSRLRAEVRAARRALPAAQREAETAATVTACWALAVALAPPALASYAALPGELDLAALHRAWLADGGTLLLPRVDGPGRLAWHAVDDPAGLRPGSFGVPEPDPQRHPLRELAGGALLLVPGVAFTSDGHRLGQGGGFYDRLLAAAPAVVAVGVGFACQLRERLPLEPHDHPLPGLVIAGRLLRDPRQA